MKNIYSSLILLFAFTIGSYWIGIAPHSANAADQRIQYDECMVGANDPTRPDTLNRHGLVEHNNDGTHNLLTKVTDPYIDIRAHDAVEGADSTVAIQAAIDAAIFANKDVFIPEGTWLFSAKLLATLTGNDITRSFGIKGVGRGKSILKYTGVASIGSALELDVAGSGNEWSNNNILEGFKIDLTGAPANTNGIRINDGVWRSRFRDLYITRDALSPVSGYGIFMGSETASKAGSFDNKFSELYINNFGRNFYGAGTSMSGNTITDLSISDSYLSSGLYNLYLDYALGVSITGSQLELAETAGAYFANSDTILFLGGAIESTVSGAKGIELDSVTDSVIALCDFYNNDGGNFPTNGKLGHFFKTANSGLVVQAGSEIRVDSDGTYTGKIRFFKNGVANTYFGVSAASDSISIYNSSDTERFGFNMTAGVMDVLLSTGRFRARDGAYFEFLNSGVSTTIHAGAGSPEGVVTANLSSLYLNRSGGTPPQIYVKDSGSGNTGWLLLDRDSNSETVTTASPTLAVYGSTSIDSSSNAVDGTLGSGEFIGQIKTIVMTNAANSSTISITNHQTSDPEVATFDAVDETGVFMWTGTEWVTIFATCTFL